MVVCSAFGTLAGTTRAGITAYYRAPGCDSITIADVLPILSKIDHYEDEYVIGEMLIWDTGTQSGEPNNCAMVHVIVYNDGWICTWFDKTDQNQCGTSACAYVDDQTLSGWVSTLEYEDRYNGCQLKITGTTDPAIPVDTIFTIRNSDHVNGRISVHANNATGYEFHTGYTYNTEIYMSNGNLLWWGVTSTGNAVPPNNSNRLYRTIYQVWEQVKGSSNSTNWSPTNASLVYMYDSQTGVYTNETTDFNDVGADDCQVLPTNEVINDAFYIGYTYKFNGVTITMGTPGVGSVVTWEYWDGSAWSTLSVTDGSSGFTGTGELTFDPPDDWVVTLVNAQSYFWIRTRVTTAAYTTTPLLTQGQLYLQNSISYIDNELGVYDYEFPSANYVLLCGRTDDNTPSPYYTYYYNTVLLTKIIYDHIINHGSYNRGSPTYAYSRVYINGNYIMYLPHSNSTNGYLNFDVSELDYNVGIQNVISLYTRNSQAYNKTGSILLVS